MDKNLELVLKPKGNSAGDLEFSDHRHIAGRTSNCGRCIIDVAKYSEMYRAISEALSCWSSQHFVMFEDNGRYLIRYLRSRHGTYVKSSNGIVKADADTEIILGNEVYTLL